MKKPNNRKSIKMMIADILRSYAKTDTPLGWQEKHQMAEKIAPLFPDMPIGEINALIARMIRAGKRKPE